MHFPKFWIKSSAFSAPPFLGTTIGYPRAPEGLRHGVTRPLCRGSGRRGTPFSVLRLRFGAPPARASDFQQRCSCRAHHPSRDALRRQHWAGTAVIAGAPLNPFAPAVTNSANHALVYRFCRRQARAAVTCGGKLTAFRRACRRVKSRAPRSDPEKPSGT